MRSMLSLAVFAFTLAVAWPGVAGAVVLRGQFEGRGVHDPSAQLEALKSNTGRQEYRAPESIDPTRYNELYIWRGRDKVPLGVATLN